MYILFIVAFYHRKSKEHIIGCAVYGACLLILYLFSTLYHAIGVFYHQDLLFRKEFRKLDHIAIYFMIAGMIPDITITD
jgi:hemolysin III